MADSVPNLAWTAHPDGYVAWYNQRWFEYTGTTPEQMQGWGWQRVHDPAVLPRVLERWMTSIATRQPFEMEFPLLGANGEFRWFLTRVVPVKDSNGNVLRWFGTNTDVDELRRTEQALRESQEQLTLALIASGTGTFRWEPLSRRFLLFGDNLRSLFGLEFPDEIRDLEDFIARIHPEDRANVLTAMAKGEQFSDLETEFRVLLADGSVRWLYGRGKMATNADGQPLYLVGACTDITEAKLARQALYKSEKLAAAGRLAATVAHEINNPLAAITNILYLLRTCESMERAQDYINMADEELRRIAHITKQTLGFYRESGSSPSEFDLSVVMDSILLVLSNKLKSKALTVAKDFDNSIMVVGVEGEYRQIISNLLANAIDASPVGSEIRIEIETSISTEGNRQMVWRVKDSGSGIAPEHLSKIFEPFFTTKRDVGTGLGLWVSNELVTKHGGKIELITSTEPERCGTCVSALLPVTSAFSTNHSSNDKTNVTSIPN